MDPESYVNAYWYGDRVVLLRRDETGRLLERRIPAEYSFFLRLEDYRRVERDVQATRARGTIRTIREEGEFVRISCRDPDFRYKICRGDNERGSWLALKGIEESYEADIHPVRRFLIDSGCGIQKPTRVYLDMEWDSRVPFSKKEQARILCWSLTFDSGERVSGVLEEDTDEAERELILDLFAELEDVDQVLAWYGDGADFPILKHKIRTKYNLPIELRRWLWLDHLEVFRKYNMHSAESGDEKDSMALERVAHSLGIDVTEKTAVSAAMSWELWSGGGEGRQALVRRNVFDSYSMWLIEKKTGYVDLHYAVCATCGCFPDSRGLRAVVHVEAFVMRLAAERQIRFRSMWGQERQEREQFRGAFVLEPQTGIARDVHVCDFSGMYPSIIQSWNMSPETWCPQLQGNPGEKLEDVAARLPPGHCVAPGTLAVFRNEPAGILALAIGTIKQMRKKWNKIKEAAVPNSPEWLEADRLSQGAKIAVNSHFGVASSPFSRLFVRQVGESITLGGKWLLEQTMRYGEDRGIRAIAGDTDSTFAVGIGQEGFRQFVEDCNKRLYPELMSRLGCARNEISLDYEKEFEILITIAKKRYAGRYKHFKGKLATDATKPVIKGLEYKRGDQLRLTRHFQEQMIHLLLLVGHPMPKLYPLTPESVIPLIEEWRAKVLEGTLEARDVTITKSLSRELDGYEIKKKLNGEDAAQPIHIQIARRLAARGEDVSEGTRIAYVITDGLSGSMQAVPLSEYQAGMEDRGYLWTTCVWPPTERILSACWPHYRWERFAELPNRGGGKGRSRYGAGQIHMDFFWDSRK